MTGIALRDAGENFFLLGNRNDILYFRVLGISYDGEERENAPYGALIGQDGEVADLIKLEHFLNRIKSPIEKQRFDKEKDNNRLRDFIKKKRPHVIVVGAEDRQAMDIMRDIQVRTLKINEK